LGLTCISAAAPLLQAKPLVAQRVAMRGRDALTINWDETQSENRSTATIFADYAALAEKPGVVAVQRGDSVAGLDAADRIVSGEFRFPYLAHAPMEPLNCVIEMRPDGSCEIWAGAQLQTVEQLTVATILGIKPEQVKINTVWAGGSFGRRATPNADYFAEAAAILRATSAKYPVHLVYTREDDIKGGRYRPMFYHKVQAGLDQNGRLVAWQDRLVGQSFIIGSPLESMVAKNGVDATAVEGAADMPYSVPNLSIDWHNPPSPVSTLW
jgi:isoquinoline 1-oxidoreductase beta subunit